MPEQTLQQTLEFFDDKGNAVAKLRIYPSLIEPGNLFCLDDADARQYGEEPLQICEGQRCEYDLETIAGARLRLVLANDFTNEILVPSRNPKHVNSGQIVPGLRTGRLGLAVQNENGEIAGTQKRIVQLSHGYDCRISATRSRDYRSPIPYVAWESRQSAIRSTENQIAGAASDL